ncbi:MAG: hypothetical protein SGI77_06870 [Pirellulaceae bacterium]|nr:hypothetical protein [Pirellulaceae bacterium]
MLNAKIDIPEEQILQSLDQLSPSALKEALRRLLPSPSYLETAVELNRTRIEALAKTRGLDWNSLSEEQRETLVNEILHE